MINLLPSYYKDKINQEKNWKKLLILQISFIVLLLFLLSSLFFLKENIFSLLKKEDYLKNDIDFSRVAEKEATVNSFNRKFSELNYFYRKSTRTINLIEDIYLSLPEGTYIKTIDFSKKIDPSLEEEVNQVILSGYSPNWDLLLEIENNLNDNFSSVEFSSSTWTQVEDINFLVSFQLI